MMEGIRRRLSFANVTSLLALMVALGGTSYAAGLAKNSVGSEQIRSKAVKNSDLGDSAVTSKKVKNGALLAKDFAIGQLPKGATGAAGQTGATGVAGEKGATGMTGATGAFGTATVVFAQAAADLPDNTSASYQAFCPSGKQGIAGGARGDATDSEATSVTSSRPSVSSASTNPPLTGGSFTGWRITARNLLGGVTTGIRPEVWVVCVPAPVP